LAPVHGSGPAIDAEISVPPPQAPRRWWIAAAAAALVLVGLSVGLFVGSRRSLPSPPTLPIAERRLTANLSEYPVRAAAISPDGKYLAFSDDTGSYLRQIDTRETHSLTLPEGFKAMPVCWLPDGSHILVTSVTGSEQHSGLWQISTVGGSPRKLSDEAHEAAVSPDGSRIVFLKGGARSQELWLMRADGEQSRKLAGQLGDLFRSPVWSTDGKQIAFLRGVYHPGECCYGVVPQIEILDVASNLRKVVLSQVRFGPALAWTNDHLVYVLDEAPPNQNDSNVWSVKIDPHTGKPLGTATRLTAGPG
jgi:Tol biopolymer transport system component